MVIYNSLLYSCFHRIIQEDHTIETSKKNSRLNYFVHVNTVTLSFHSFYCMKYKCSCFAFEVVLSKHLPL